MLEKSSPVRIFFAFCLVFLLAIAGCGNGDDNGDLCEGVTCPDGQVCNPATGDCEPEGTNGDLCEGVACPSGQICDPATGTCVPDGSNGNGNGNGQDDCEVDSDCNDPTLECRHGECVSKCQGVTCPTGEVCEPTTGQCIESGTGPSCTTDMDCDYMNYPGNSEKCVDGVCLGTFSSDCTNVDCTSEYDCITLQYQDGTVTNTCMQACSQAADCPYAYFRCVDIPGAGNYCEQNLCGTDPIFDQAGYSTTTWNGPCDIDGSGDGFCIGPLFAQSQGVGTLELGLCWASGGAAPGATCNMDAGHGDPLACDNGLCMGPEGATQGECHSTCTFNDGVECPDANGQPHACAGPIFGMGRVGACLPQSETPADTGETCNDQVEELQCVEDHVCGALEQGASATCHPWCNLLSPDCPAGLTCMMMDADEDLLGICATN